MKICAEAILQVAGSLPISLSRHVRAAPASGPTPDLSTKNLPPYNRSPANLPKEPRRLMARLWVGVLSVLIALTQIGSSVAYAQNVSDDIDFDPPVIDHESLVTGVAGKIQVISALVVDDRGLERVTLFYRSASGQDYRQIGMQQLAGTDNYTASVDSTVEQKKIDYYIEALDTGGNRVLKGFPFFPLVRTLEAPATAPVPEVQEAVPASSQNKLVYVLLGVLAVGLLASLGGDSSGGGGGDPVDNTVPLTINVTPP